MQQNTIKLTDLTDAVVLIGSMLSSDDASILPAGQTVSARLVEKIVQPALQSAPSDLGLTKEDINCIDRLALNTPFEVLLQHHPEPGLARKHLAELYKRGTPNPLHFALAKAVKRGHISHIITTNYDTCIEDALRTEMAPQVVIEEQDTLALDWSPPDRQPVLFKIHGCAHIKQTMVFQLSQESALPAWKRALLKQMIDGRDIVVMGYSGLDFDICPVLFALPYDRLFWLFREKDDLSAAVANSSQNVQNAHRKEASFKRVFGTMGGFDAIFDGLLTDPNYQFKPSSAQTDIADKLFENEVADPFNYQLWRGWLLHTISCRLGSEAVYRTMSSSDKQRTEALRLWSDTLERAGRYSDSVRILYQLEKQQTANNRHDEALETLFVIAGRRYTASRLFLFLQAWRRYLRRIEQYEIAQVKFDSLLAEARGVYLFSLALKTFARIPAIGKIFMRQLGKALTEDTLQKAASQLFQRGYWHDVQLLRSAAKDLEISFEVTDPYGSNSDPDLLLSTVDAFSHANNVVGQSSAYRREANKTRARCEELLEALETFGHSAEFWKAFESFAPLISDRKRRLYQGFAFSELMRCQYPVLTKLRHGIRLLLIAAKRFR